MNEKCQEYAGPATGTGQRRRCQKDATWHALFLGKWRPLCQYHIREYYDLPNHRAGIARRYANADCPGHWT